MCKCTDNSCTCMSWRTFVLCGIIYEENMRVQGGFITYILVTLHTELYSHIYFFFEQQDAFYKGKVQLTTIGLLIK